jgi:hypothetical protein
MAKQRASSQKRDREFRKRERDRKKREKAALKRERRMGNQDAGTVPSTTETQDDVSSDQQPAGQDGIDGTSAPPS